MSGPLAPRAAGSLEWDNPGSLTGEDAGSHNETMSLCVWGEDAGYGCHKRDCVEFLLPQEIRERGGPRYRGAGMAGGATGPVSFPG